MSVCPNAPPLSLFDKVKLNHYLSLSLYKSLFKYLGRLGYPATARVVAAPLSILSDAGYVCYVPFNSASFSGKEKVIFTCL